MPIPQILANSLIRAAELSLISLGLTMVYDILQFANFAHTEFAVVGVYLALFFNVTLGVDIVPAALLAVILTGLLGIGVDRAVFKRLRGSGRVTLMVTSLGVAIVLRNIIRAIWGPEPQNYTIGLQRPLTVAGVRITPVQISIITTAVVFMVAFHLLLHQTKLGKAMRAASDNAALAQASGIATERVIVWVWFIGTAFAAVGGILIGLETYVKPYMGFAIIIPVFCATILGGIGNPYGAMLGALVLGLAENVGLYVDFGRLLNLGGLLHFFGELRIPTGYKAAISFAMLIGILLIRPAGILGGSKET
jgi:branched-subunit amino acid ABC-type transport system permease component